MTVPKFLFCEIVHSSPGAAAWRIGAPFVFVFGFVAADRTLTQRRVDESLKTIR